MLVACMGLSANNAGNAMAVCGSVVLWVSNLENRYSSVKRWDAVDMYLQCRRRGDDVRRVSIRHTGGTPAQRLEQ